MKQHIPFAVFVIIVLSGGTAVATDFTITRNAGDNSNAILIETSTGLDQFWVDVNGFVYANGTQIRVNTLTCTGTDKFSAWDNSTGTFTCSADDSSGAPASIHLIGNVTSVGCAVNEILKVNSTGFFACATDGGGGGTLESLTNVTSTGCAEGQIRKVSGTTWECANDTGLTEVQFSYLITQTGTAHKFYTIVDSTGTVVTTSNGDLTAAWDIMDTDAASLDGVIYQFGVGDFYVNTTLTTEHDNVIIRGFGAGATIIHAATNLPTSSLIFYLTESNGSEDKHNIGGLEKTFNNSFFTDVAGNATNFLVGDRIILISDKCVDIAKCDRKQGEIHEVEIAGNGATGEVRMRGNTWQSFDNSDNPQVMRIPKFIDNITMDGFTLVNDHTALTSSTTTTQGIAIRQANNVVIKNIVFQELYRAAFYCQSCTNLLFTNNDVDIVRGGDGGFNYGISAFGGANHLITDNHFKYTRHIYTNAALADGNNGGDKTFRGGVFNLVINGNTSIDTTGGHISLHESSPYAVISNNVLQGGNDDGAGLGCIGTRSNYTTIIGNTCSGVNFAYATSEGSTGSIISGNVAFNVKSGIIINGNSSEVTITNNYINYNSFNGIFLSNNDSIDPIAGDSTLISGNYIIANNTAVGNGAGISINSQQDVTIMNNVIKNIGKGIHIADTHSPGDLDDIVITYNIFDGVTTPIDDDGDDVDSWIVGNIGSGVVNSDRQPLFLTEQVSADGDVGGDGQLWIKTATPNLQFFTDDAGTDFPVGGHIISQFLTADDANSPVSNSDTPIDSEFTFEAVANGVYAGYMVAVVTGGATSDFRWDFTGPSGMTGYHASHGGGVYSQTSLGSDGSSSADANVRTTIIEFLFTASATPGTVTFRYAQLNPVVEDTILQQNSWWRVEQINA